MVTDVLNPIGPRPRIQLDGSWRNQSPGFPVCDISAKPWTMSQSGRKVTARWEHGTSGAAVGRFTGTSVTGDGLGDDRVEGTYEITDGGRVLGKGTMTFVVHTGERFDFSSTGIAGSGTMLLRQRTTQAVAAKCRAPKAQPKPKPAVPANTFTLAATRVTNLNERELKINAAGGTAHLDHCCDGGKWVVDYTWKVPPTLTADKSASISLSLKVLSVEPSQPLGVQMSALAPGFREEDLPPTTRTCRRRRRPTQRRSSRSTRCRRKCSCTSRRRTRRFATCTAAPAPDPRRRCDCGEEPRRALVISLCGLGGVLLPAGTTSGVSAPRTVAVPRVTALVPEDAYAKPRAAGLRVTIPRPFTLYGNVYVRDQLPHSGARLTHGSVVTIRFARGFTPIGGLAFESPLRGYRVPSLIGDTFRVAWEKLEARHLTLRFSFPALTAADAPTLLDAYVVTGQMPRAGDVWRQATIRRGRYHPTPVKVSLVARP